MTYPFEHNEGLNKPKQNECFERLLNFHKLFSLTYSGYGLNVKERLFVSRSFRFHSTKLLSQL
jgi:hypothetical protein